jgi:NAD(P)-dependent dehydrogenase (short-subunit alcohol dehydrogenase family)
LVKDGWEVFAAGHRAEELADLTPHSYEADVADARAVSDAILAAGQALSEVDLWIYAAGDITAGKVAELEPDAWQRILDANLVGAYVTASRSLPLLAPDAHLVFLGAVSERLRLPRISAYAAAKAGLEAFVEVLGKEERKRRVTLVRPAAVDTPLWDKSPFKLPANALPADEVAARILALHEEGHKGVVDL